jgi:DNA-binding MarR family transcriptional regulator
MRIPTLEQPLDRRKSQTFPPSEKNTTTREPFAALPHAIAGRPDITPTEKAVLLALLFWAKAKAICWPSDASIGARIGRSVGTVQRALRRLEVLGLIVRQKTADNPTGRLIVLVWVAERQRATPLSPALEPPAPPARDEGRNEKEEQRPVAGAGRVSPPLPAGEPAEPDLATLHQWAEGADPILRRIARARLAELESAAETQEMQAMQAKQLDLHRAGCRTGFFITGQRLATIGPRKTGGVFDLG